jgi:hypothetical protein
MVQSLLEKTLNKSFELLRERVSDNDLLIDNIIIGTSFYRLTNYSTTLGDMSFYLAIIGQGDSGFAYFNPEANTHPPSETLNYVNKNVLDILSQDLPHPLRVALSDAVIGVYNRSEGLQPNNTFKAEGSYAYKAAVRANLLTEDIQPGENVLLVGAVSEIAKEVLTKKGNLKITDLSKEKAKSHLYGVPIELTNGNTLKRMDEADTAIITGATFSSKTVDGIIDMGIKFNTKMIFYLETANNLGPHLIDVGVSKVVAEKFPFYDMPGTTFMEVYKHD